MNCRTLLLATIVLVALSPANADMDDLSGGVLFVHAPPDIVYSSGAAWCDSTKLEDCEDQVTRIDGEGPHVWFVLSAWAEEKTFSAVEFGLGDFDPASFGFVEDGLCLDGVLGIYNPSSETWPGANTGIALASTKQGWSGSIVPICWMAGYCYTEADRIPLVENPATNDVGWIAGLATKSGRFDSLRDPYAIFRPVCMGALGLGCEGIRCCPGSNAAAAGADSSLSYGGCTFPYALAIAEGNRLEFRGTTFSVTFGPGEVVEIDFRDGRFTLNDTLVNAPAERPKRPDDPRMRAARYGDIPFVQKRLAGRDDEESWAVAVQAYRDERDSLLAAAREAYEAALPESREAGIAAAVAVIEARRDIITSIHVLDKAPPKVTLMLRAGMFNKEMWRLDRTITPAERAPTQRRACAQLRRLKSLERHIPGWPAEWTMEGGQIDGGRHRKEP